MHLQTPLFSLCIFVCLSLSLSLPQRQVSYFVKGWGVALTSANQEPEITNIARGEGGGGRGGIQGAFPPALEESFRSNGLRPSATKISGNGPSNNQQKMRSSKGAGDGFNTPSDSQWLVPQVNPWSGPNKETESESAQETSGTWSGGWNYDYECNYDIEKNRSVSRIRNNRTTTKLMTTTATCLPLKLLRNKTKQTNNSAEIQLLVKGNSKPHGIVIYTGGAVT